MTEAIRIHNTGGPEVMSWEAVNLAAPGPGEVLVRHHYVGVNFIDIYHRRGMYKLSLPSGLGSEAAGVVEAVGPGVSELRVGDQQLIEVFASHMGVTGFALAKPECSKG